MKRIFLCAASAALLVLSGCGGPFMRGVSVSDGTFVSVARPAVSVKAAEGFATVVSGRSLCRVPVEDSISGGPCAEVWYSVDASDRAQLAVVVAECSGPLVWKLGSHGQEYQRRRLLYEKYGDAAGSFDTRVYVRPASLDPWLARIPAAGEDWKRGVMVARFDALFGADRSKFILEYREPVPAELGDGVAPEGVVMAFLDRARASFSLGKFAEPGGGLRPSDSPEPPDRLLGPVIGSVELPPRIEHM